MTRVWAAFLILGCGVAPPGSAQSAEEARYNQDLSEARQVLARDEFEAVVKKLTPWVKRFSDRAEARHGIGLAHYHLENFEAAIEHLSAALKLEAEQSPVWKQTVQFLGMAYYIRHGWTDAIPLLEKALVWEPGDTDLLYALASCYLHAHELDKARVSYAGLYRIEPDSPQAFLLAAHLMYQAAYGQDAESLLAPAAKKWPDWPEFNYQLGAVAMIKGDYPSAVQYLEKELARNPANSLAWHNLGEAFLRLSKLGEATEALQRAIWINGQYAKSYVLLAEIHLLQQNPYLAEDALGLALQLEPQNYAANFMLARIYQRTNRPELAKKQMQIADKLRPK